MTSEVNLSVIVPFFNERLALPDFVAVLKAELSALSRTYEVLFVNDGSTDQGPEWLEAFVARDWPEARVIHLSRNFGHMPALTAGLDASRGLWVGSLDSDLQHPPAVLIRLLAAAESTGSLVAQATRSDRTADSIGKRASATVYYALMKRLTSVNVPTHSADFRVLHRTVVDDLCALPERVRVYRLLLPWLGYKTVQVPYEAAPRIAGRSKYSLRRMLRLGLGSVTSFSAVPLRIATGIGMAFGLFGLLAVVLVIGDWIFNLTAIGWPSLMAAVLILGSVQLLTIGILGEYVAEILEQVRGRPMYVVAPPLPRTPDAGDPARPGRDITVELNDFVQTGAPRG